MNILKWVLIGLITFILAVGAMLGAMIYLSPAPKKDETAQSVKHAKKKYKGKIPEAGTSRKKVHISASEGYKVRIDSLQHELDSLKTVHMRAQAQLAEKDKELEKLQSLLAGKADRDARAKDLARTLSSMKVKKMAPILAGLDDRTVIDIYRQMSSANRKNILLGLSGDRAAMVAKKLINP